MAATKEDLDAHVAQDSAGPTCRGVGQKVVLQEWCKPNSLPQAGVEGAESPVRLDGAPPPTRPAHLKPIRSKNEGAQATHLPSGWEPSSEKSEVTTLVHYLAKFSSLSFFVAVAHS